MKTQIHLKHWISMRQPSFVAIEDLARLLGVRPITIKRIENGSLKISHDLAARVFLATGFMMLETSAGAEALNWTGEPYTRESFDLWKRELEANSAVASALTAQLVRWIEILMLASARPSAGKTVQVFHALLQSVNTITEQFQLQKQIDAHLTERHSSETQLYRVGDLRNNSLLAEMVDFRDDPRLKDDDQIPLTKSIGWSQHRELFNVLWNHRDVLQQWICAGLSASHSSPEIEAHKANLGTDLESIF